ncbi:hypothetical protein K439DRAFT_1624116 [Ramaria rubella]|nr:hypothetical protein K439DRAFT_1624116 [Ramaria rubella]
MRANTVAWDTNAGIRELDTTHCPNSDKPDQHNAASGSPHRGLANSPVVLPVVLTRPSTEDNRGHGSALLKPTQRQSAKSYPSIRPRQIKPAPVRCTWETRAASAEVWDFAMNLTSPRTSPLSSPQSPSPTFRTTAENVRMRGWLEGCGVPVEYQMREAFPDGRGGRMDGWVWCVGGGVARVEGEVEGAVGGEVGGAGGVGYAYGASKALPRLLEQPLLSYSGWIFHPLYECNCCTYG